MGTHYRQIKPNIPAKVMSPARIKKTCSCGRKFPKVPAQAKLVDFCGALGFMWLCSSCSSSLFWPVETETREAV